MSTKLSRPTAAATYMGARRPYLASSSAEIGKPRMNAPAGRAHTAHAHRAAYDRGAWRAGSLVAEGVVGRGVVGRGATFAARAGFPATDTP